MSESDSANERKLSRWSIRYCLTASISSGLRSYGFFLPIARAASPIDVTGVDSSAARPA